MKDRTSPAFVCIYCQKIAPQDDCLNMDRYVQLNYYCARLIVTIWLNAASQYFVTYLFLLTQLSLFQYLLHFI